MNVCLYTYGATQWAAVKTCVSDIKLAPQYCPEPEFEGRSKAASQGQAFFSESMPPTTDSMGGGFFSKSERSLFVLFVNVNGLGDGNIIRVFLIPQPAKVKISSNSFSVTNSIYFIWSNIFQKLLSSPQKIAKLHTKSRSGCGIKKRVSTLV